MLSLSDYITRYRDRHDLTLTFVGAQRLTYPDFFARVNGYLGWLNQDVPPGGIVLIDGVKTANSVAAAVACILSGRGYSFLDVSLPKARKDQILTAIRPALYFEAVEQGLEPRRPTEGAPRSFAGSVVFTSGSTGHPKGVFSSYDALAHYVDSMLDCMGDEPQTWLSICPVHFDVFQLDVLVQLARGANIVFAGSSLLPQQYLNIIVDEGVTEVLYISTLLKMTVQMVDRLPPHRLRRIYFGGEGCSIPVLQQAMALFEGLPFCQFYGPTENTNNTTCNHFDALRDSPTGFMPLGKPIKHVRIDVIGADGEVCAPGEVGEFVMSGPQLFSGYLDTMTGRFDAHLGAYHSNDMGYRDEDGDLWFTGRQDDVVKVNGNRVSLIEINSRIQECVRDATVSTVVRDRAGFQSLVSGVHSPGPFDPDRIVAHLASCLPGYCVPSEIVRLPDDKVTRLSTGKTNYKLIKDYLNSHA